MYNFNFETGKSAVGNVLLGSRVFPVGDLERSTQLQPRYEGMTTLDDGRRLRVVDTSPCLLNNEDAKSADMEYAKIVDVFSSGVHAFVYVRNSTHARWTDEDDRALCVLQVSLFNYIGIFKVYLITSQGNMRKVLKEIF